LPCHQTLTGPLPSYAIPFSHTPSHAPRLRQCRRRTILQLPVGSRFVASGRAACHCGACFRRHMLRTTYLQSIAAPGSTAACETAQQDMMPTDHVHDCFCQDRAFAETQADVAESNQVALFFVDPPCARPRLSNQPQPPRPLHMMAPQHQSRGQCISHEPSATAEGGRTRIAWHRINSHLAFA
jgi:hypothetical protein